MALMSISCKKDNDESENNETPTIDTAPNLSEVLPDSLRSKVLSWINIYEGDSPYDITGEYVSSPHKLFYSSAPDTNTYYYDRYLCFVQNGNKAEFLGAQGDTTIAFEDWELEHFYKMRLYGNDTAFSCYYIIKGYMNHLPVSYSTIFSGKKAVDSIGETVGIRDFMVATILLETSGIETLQPQGTYRIIGDEDKLAVRYDWLGKKEPETKPMTEDDLFKMWMR